MFLPYRTIGYVLDSNPPILKKVGTQNFIYATIGRSWQVYGGNRLRLRLTAPERESQISAIASLDNGYVCTAVGQQIIIWNRTNEATRVTPPTGNNISRLLSIGNNLISLSRDGHLYVWDCTTLSRSFAIAEQSDAIKTGIASTTTTTSTSTTTKLKNTLATDNLYQTKIEPISYVSHCQLTPPPNPTQTKTTVQHTFGLESQKITTVETHSHAYITSWCHPPTYNNKLVIGWSNGVVELWNIRTGKMIHRFISHYQTQTVFNKNKHEQDATNDIIKSSGIDTPLEQTLQLQNTHSISCLEPSFVLDIIAIGKTNGDIILLNLKLDQTVQIFHQQHGVSTLSFRTDNNYQHLISASTHGDLTLWDLTTKSSLFTHHKAHGSTITAAFFLYKEPILITAGTDNALIQWHFDGTRMVELRTQQGHWKPPKVIKWYDSRTILTGGGDGTLRFWSPTRDRSAKTLSWAFIPDNAHRSERGERGGYLSSSQRKIRGLDLISMYHPNQPSAVTLNSGDTDKVTLWEIENCRATKLIGQSLSRAIVTCFSYCGQFVFIGYDDGEVKKFNIQSNAFRCTFTPERVISNAHGDNELNLLTRSKQEKKRQRKQQRQQGEIIDKTNAHGTNPHQHGISGMFCAQGNEYLITIGTDGIIYTWDIDREGMLNRFDLQSPIHTLSFSLDTNLLGIITATNDIYLIDCERLCIVREWKNHIGPRLDQILLHPQIGLMFITDIMGGLRTYDLTSGMMIDNTIFSRPITSIDICPTSRDSRSTGDMIATTHVGAVGIYLWILNPNRQIATALTVHQHFMNGGTNGTQNQMLQATNRIQLAGGNVALSIDNESLQKEQEKYQKEQTKLYQLHQDELNAFILNRDEDEDNDNDNNKVQYSNQMNDNSSDDDNNDEDDENDDNYNHRLTPQERLYYKKMKNSNHFLTVNVVRNMSFFDSLITKPKPSKADITIDDNEDTDELKLIKSQRIMQQVLFKQLHNEMNTKLSMLSGIASSRWKLLTQQQALAQRNERIKQAQIMANKNVPFFLNIQTAQKKNDASTTYTLEKGSTLLEQQEQIQNSKNNTFTNHFGLGNNNDCEPVDLISQCLQIDSICNLSEYIWEKGSFELFGGSDDEEDDDLDNVLVSVNDKKRLQEKTKKEQELNTKPKTKKEIAVEKARIEREKQEKLAIKKRKEDEKALLQKSKKDVVAAFLRFLYLHILPDEPTQEWIEQYNKTHQNDSLLNELQTKSTSSSTTSLTVNPFASLLTKQQPTFTKPATTTTTNNTLDITSIFANANNNKKGGNTKNNNNNKFGLKQELVKTKTAQELHDEFILSLKLAYQNEIKDLQHKLHINIKIDKKSLTPLMTYILVTPPSLLSSQISSFESERELYIFLHTMFLLSTNIQGGLIDAVSALIHHTLQQHSVLISESFLLRVLCNLLVKSLSSQWKQIETLLHSNIAVVNHLAGLHQGF